MDWSKLLSLPGPTATAGFIASAGISWGYSHKFGLLQKIPEQYIIYANLGVFVFGAIACVWLSTALIHWFRSIWRNIEIANEMGSLLDTLAQDERDLLYSMANANQRSITLPLIDPLANRLKQKRMLIPGAGVGNAWEWSFAIPPDVWRQLKKRLNAMSVT